MNTSTASNTAPASVLLTVEQEETIKDCLKKLHHIVGGSAFGPNGELPVFSMCGQDEYKTVCVRTLTHMNIAATTRKKALFAGARAKVEAKISEARDLAADDAAEYAALSPRLQAKMDPPADTVQVMISDLVGCFPAGTDLVKVLKDMDYTVCKGGKGKRGEEFRISAPFKPLTETK